MAPATDEDFNIDMRQSLTGIGARLTSEDGYVKVVEILPGGPAEKDGRLKPGDRIVAIAQHGSVPEDVIDKPLTKVVQRIRGEKGTTVLLTILENDTNHTAVIDLVRDVVQARGWIGHERGAGDRPPRGGASQGQGGGDLPPLPSTGTSSPPLAGRTSRAPATTCAG